MRPPPVVGSRPFDTHSKALEVNLDPRRYGTFAEIGAGQEVVRWFFRVGGAAGTIAKSMSAYDMTVSDAIYGAVRALRLPRSGCEAMLDHEHDAEPRPARASAAATRPRSSRSPTRCRPATSRAPTSATAGWACGSRPIPRDQDSQIIIHVRMLDTENALQQEALGIVGVNLLYGAFFLHHEPEQLVESLLDNLTHAAHRDRHDRVLGHRVPARRQPRDEPEAGAARPERRGDVRAPTAKCCSPPRCSTRSRSWSSAAASARSPTSTSTCSRCAREKFVQRAGRRRRARSSQLMEITMRNLHAPDGRASTCRDFLARADVLAACGKTVLISDYFEYYRLAAYLRPLHQAADRHHDGRRQPARALRREVLRAARRRHPRVVRPAVQERSEALRLPAAGPRNGRRSPTVENLEVAPELRKLYGYLVDTRLHRAARQLQPRATCTSSRATSYAGSARATRAGRRWSPGESPQVIIGRNFFGYRRPAPARENVTPAQKG